MLTLTANDKAYVRAVAHGGAHDMYKGIFKSTQTSANYYLGTAHDRYHMFHLSHIPKTQIEKDWHGNNSWELQDLSHNLPVAHVHNDTCEAFDFPKGTDVSATTKNHHSRYGDNVFLDSTNLRIRISMPQARFNLDEQCMARFIVVRSKEKQSNIVEKSLDHANPHYDLFINSDGFEVGLNGYVDHVDAENYIKNTGHQGYPPMMQQNLMINKRKYVIMKDCKFNLGKDFGALAFETRLRWDWQDQMMDIPAVRPDVTSSDDGDGPLKNYSWYMICLATNPIGGEATQTLNVEMFGTTHAKTLD